MPIEFENTLACGAKILGTHLSPEQIQLFNIHASQLSLYSKKINLTAIKTFESIAEKHFIDSIAVAPFIPGQGSLLDLGSGGGFPGIPLKIMHPNLNVILIDASRKKVNFLKHVIRMLGLKNIEAIHTRVEELYEQDEFTGQYDTVISRAFTELQNFVRMATPFLSPHGTICAMKGKNAQNELGPVVEAQYEIKKHYYQLPFEKSDRYIYMLQPKHNR